MKNINKAWKIYSILFTALCVTYALSDQPGSESKSTQPRAILNAKELGIDDLDMDLDSIEIEDLDLGETSEPAVEEPADEEIAEVVEETPAAIEEEVAEVVETAEPAVEETVVEEIAEVVEETPAAVEEEVAEVVEEAPAKTEFSNIDEEIDAILGVVGDSDNVAEEPADTTSEEVVEATSEAKDVAEVVVEEAPVVAEVKDEQPASSIDTAIDEAMTIEAARRAAYDKHVMQNIKTSEDNLARARFETVIKDLTEVEQYIRESRVDLKNKVDELLAEAYYRKSIGLRQAANYTEAENVARQARTLGHPNAGELLIQIQNEKENPPKPTTAKKIKRWNERQYEDSLDDIRSRLSRAREYYSTGEYDLCRREVEFCLRDYPWCKDAVGMLRKVNSRLNEFYDDERLSTRKKMLSEVTKAWTPDNYGVGYEDTGYDSRRSDSSGDSVITLGTTEEMKILEKMKRITIREIEFRQANITDVITFLSEASREYDEDKDIPEERRGINIILNLGGSGETASTAQAADTFAGGWEAAAPETTTDSSNGVPPITVNARFVTLYDALGTVMKVAKLKYRVNGNMVLVMPENAPDGDLIHRMYPVLPSFVEKARSLRETDKASGDFGDAIQIETAKFDDNQDWKKFFGELGVHWPEGSSVKYVASIGKLIVKNTSEQLSSLEKVLAELNVTPQQVEIEVRFVEVMQTDLDSLGFEWSIGQVGFGGGIIDGQKNSAKTLGDDRSGGRTAITKAFNFLTNNSSVDVNGGASLSDDVIGLQFLSNSQVNLVLHMLSTKKNSDLLSAPKVVTASGREATIKVVTEYIYPTSYDVEMLETSDDDDNTTYSGAVVQPGDFMTREVGVILSVTPEVAPDGSRIYLRLAPSVISEPLWKNYGSKYPSPSGDVELPMEQPFFPVRSVVTELEVYNGSTVVMGGMITEERIAVEDKIPVLGDIPLIGRFFRNNYEQSEKRNLLLFVTARLVDAGGRAIKNPSTTGIFGEK